MNLRDPSRCSMIQTSMLLVKTPWPTHRLPGTE